MTQNDTPAFHIRAGRSNRPCHSLRQPTLMTKWPLRTINNMNSFSSAFIFSSRRSCCSELCFCSHSSPLCWICFLLLLCWQALCSQNAFHRESDWRKSVRLQTSAEEDLPEEEAHQTVLNTELSCWASLDLICPNVTHDMWSCSGPDPGAPPGTFQTVQWRNKKRWLCCLYASRLIILHASRQDEGCCK